MRFRPANISLINRRHYLPSASADLVLEVRRQKNNPSDLQILTGSHHINLRVDRVLPTISPENVSNRQKQVSGFQYAMVLLFVISGPWFVYPSYVRL